MRRQLRVAVMDEFERLMKRDFPSFSLIRRDRNAMELILEYSISDDLSLFIRVLALDQTEEFDIELAWSETPAWGHQPEFPAHVSSLMSPDDPPDAGGACFSLHWLKPNPSRVVTGWELVPAPDLLDFDGWLKAPPKLGELLERVPELVGEAVDELSKLAPPYFRRLLDARGVDLA